MNYYIDIYDTTDDTHTTVLENARANSIKLNWQGKDAIDELDVVGSSLGFTLEATWDANDDGAFVHLFTGNEVKYRVDLRLEDDDSLVWQGFLLPDSYSEPYKTGNFFVGLEATDGLGRLKGKYLDDSYYEDEKSVIDIISSCLALTGLEFEIVFAPGVENKVEKDWSNIYIDGLNYVENNRNWTAYKILQTFLQDTLSCVYQHKGVWRVEGLNKRNLADYNGRRYTADGTFIATETVSREVKSIDGKILGAGNVTMAPPYNNITVTHQATTLQFPATIATEENDGWVTEAAGVSGEIYATDWYPNNAVFWAKAKAPDYKVWLENNDDADPDYNKYIQLLSKIYVKQDTKLKFSLELSLDYYDSDDAGTVEAIIAAGHWTDNLYYKIQVGTETLFTNIGTDVSTAETIQFDDEKKASIAFEFIIPESGLLDVLLYQPYGVNSVIGVKGVFIDEISIEEIGFDESIIYTTTINEDYTIDKDHTVVFADAASGLGNVFLLAKLRNVSTSYKTIQANVLYGFTQSGNNYSAVSLEDANAIADNIDTIVHSSAGSGGYLENLEVIYNFSGGEQMLVKTDTLYTSGYFVVLKFRINDYSLDRQNWEEWTDSVYVIERKRFPDAVMGVFSRLFENPAPRLDATVKEIIMFGELISWTYMDETSVFIPTNCTYDLDDGNTNIVASKASYLQINTQVPPYVDAGPDIYLYDDESTADLDATAYDPDGTISTYLWEHVSGSPAGTIASSATEDTQVTGLTGNSYVYQLTVTDDDGLTASDTVNVIRVVNYAITLPVTDSTLDTSGDEQSYEYEHTITVDPTFADGLNMVLNCAIELHAEGYGGGLGGVTSAQAKCTIIKNGVELEDYHIYGVGGANTEDYTTTFSYNVTDDIKIVLWVYRKEGTSGSAMATSLFRVDSATIAGYPGIVTGPPIEVETEIILY